MLLWSECLFTITEKKLEHNTIIKLSHGHVNNLYQLPVPIVTNDHKCAIFIKQSYITNMNMVSRCVLFPEASVKQLYPFLILLLILASVISVLTLISFSPSLKFSFNILKTHSRFGLILSVYELNHSHHLQNMHMFQGLNTDAACILMLNIGSSRCAFP